MQAFAQTFRGSPHSLAWGAGLCVLFAGVLVQFLLGGAIPAWLADKDFANYWTASRLVLSGETGDLFADHETYFRHMLRLFGPDYPWHNWSYPPHYLLFIWPLGLMDYGLAMLVFLAVTLALYLLAARAFVGRLEGGTAVVMLLPFLLATLWTAQNGFLTAALLLGGLALRHDRPIVAGFLIGCLTIKPQLGLLLPLFLLMEGRWTVIASAAATTVLLAGVSALAFGVDAWTGYVVNTMPYQSDVMNLGTGLFLSMMPSVFGALRVLGVDSGAALAAHGVVAAFAFAATALVLWRCGDRQLRAAILILATMVVTPYWLVYDFGAAAVALLAVRMRADELDGLPPVLPIQGLLFVAALVPIMAVPLGLVSLPIAPLFLAAALALTLAGSTAAGN